jgi:hypothetical protein
MVLGISVCAGTRDLSGWSIRHHRARLADEALWLRGEGSLRR